MKYFGVQIPKYKLFYTVLHVLSHKIMISEMYIGQLQHLLIKKSNKIAKNMKILQNFAKFLNSANSAAPAESQNSYMCESG